MPQEQLIVSPMMTWADGSYYFDFIFALVFEKEGGGSNFID